MTWLQSLLFLIVSFSASVAGAICGIGGGVIIKPVLDLFGWASASAINFLSGCTVLSMSCYSVSKSLLSGEKAVDLYTGTPLAVGAAAGGVVGKQLFSIIRSASPVPEAVSGIQAVCLAAVTLCTLIYTVKKQRISTLRLTGLPVCLCIGFSLGVMSSFLGIGGGPINLAVLAFCFSMDTKTASANSLYIIFFSQFTSLLSTILTNSIPAFEIRTLIFMILGGILGGMAGRFANKRLDNTAVDKLFVLLLVVIIFISGYNTWQYSAA